jgi:hypothetical protein
MSARRKSRPCSRFWIPPLMSLCLAAFLQHGCQMLAAAGLPGVWLQADALFLVFPLLYLRFAHGLPQVIFTALALDAFWPGPYGTRLVLYGIVMIAMLPLRARIRRENPTHVLWLAALMNLLLFTGLWLVAAFDAGRGLHVPLARVLGDMALSVFVTSIGAFWWMELQRRVIIMASDEDPASYEIVS